MKKVLGIVLTLTIAFAMAACGAKEDSVRARSHRRIDGRR